MRTTRIGFDARYINDRYHGIGRYAFRLLEKLVAMQPRFTFVIFRGQGENTRFQWDELEAAPNVELQTGPWPLYWPQEQLAWRGILRRAQIDLFHTPYFVAPLLARVPVLTTVHDLILDEYPEMMPMRWARPYYRGLMNLSARKASRVVTISQATAADLQAHYRLPREKILVALEGADPGFSQADSIRLAALRAGLKLEHPFTLVVGARRPHKNMARLVNAFAAIHSRVPHDLVFAGGADPRFPDEARLAAEHHGLNGRVHFVDWVSEADLVGLYHLADVVAVPSLKEGFGLPALEAMACGTPVLAANTSSLPEVVGEAGLLVDPYDTDGMAEALENLLDHPGLRVKLAAAGRARANSFRWEYTAGHILEAYGAALLEGNRT